MNHHVPAFRRQAFAYRPSQAHCAACHQNRFFAAFHPVYPLSLWRAPRMPTRSSIHPLREGPESEEPDRDGLATLPECHAPRGSQTVPVWSAKCPNPSPRLAGQAARLHRLRTRQHADENENCRVPAPWEARHRGTNPRMPVLCCLPANSQRKAGTERRERSLLDACQAAVWQCWGVEARRNAEDRDKGLVSRGSLKRVRSPIGAEHICLGPGTPNPEPFQRSWLAFNIGNPPQAKELQESSCHAPNIGVAFRIDGASAGCHVPSRGWGKKRIDRGACHERGHVL